MNFLKTSAWLGLMLAFSACQNLPISVPLSIPTAAPTNTQGPPPTPTLFPSPTPLPTMEPVVRIDTGDEALFFGDFDLAREQYLAAFNDTTDDAIKAAALWGMGRTELADGRYPEAVNSFNNLINSYPDSTYSARAPFLMGLYYYGW
jgi:tetratricopeptide (TPR) repeat protein